MRVVQRLGGLGETFLSDSVVGWCEAFLGLGEDCKTGTPHGTQNYHFEGLIEAPYICE